MDQILYVDFYEYKQKHHNNKIWWVYIKIDCIVMTTASF
jgi:hypothetical protein